MLYNYFKTAWRNLLNNKTASIINISGLSIGMTVALMIGLWVWDELSFDRDNRNYQQVARVMQNQRLNGEITTWSGVPYPLAAALRYNFRDDFKEVSLLNWASSILSYQDKIFSQNGIYVEPSGPNILDLKMMRGTRDALQDPHSILISQSAAKAIFGEEDPMNRIITVENLPVRINGVYQDQPANSSFANVNFVAPWALKLAIVKWIQTMDNPWGNNSFQVIVQLADHAQFEAVSRKIRDVKLNNIRAGERSARPGIFLQPMYNWHLYSEFKNGSIVGGSIQFVWWFGIIGIFVLALACINFMNLSTARSEKRAKEVGIRKTIGSLRSQLIVQFLGESVLLAFVALIFSLGLVLLSLPLFNTITSKEMHLPVNLPLFWLIVFAFTLFTGLIAGSYPAFFISSYKAVKVLKGAVTPGRFSALPRKALVVLQFSISLILVIGTIVIYRQVQFAKNRPVGYSRNGLMMVSMHLYDIHSHFEAIRDDLINSGSVLEIAESGNPITAVYNSNGGMSWKGKPAGSSTDIPMSFVSFDYGKTVGWKILEGRDFSREFPSDSAAFIINETAAKFMGLKNPVGEKIAFNDGVAFTVVGVVKDFIMESPYEPVRPSLFRMVNPNNGGMLNLKINPLVNPHAAVTKIEAIFKRYNPSQPFEYKFADEEYATKFGDEERIGKLVTIFSMLAIGISCLGLIGLSSFMASRRIKEIGIRKILGATVFNLWQLLSTEFVMLVLLSFLIAIPVAYYFLNDWLQGYHYRVALSWWIFASAGGGALLLTLLTVSYQAIKAAIANPVQSLRSE